MFNMDLSIILYTVQPIEQHCMSRISLLIITLLEEIININIFMKTIHFKFRSFEHHTSEERSNPPYLVLSTCKEKGKSNT